HVDELSKHFVTVLRVRKDLTARGLTSSRHLRFLLTRRLAASLRKGTLPVSALLQTRSAPPASAGARSADAIRLSSPAAGRLPPRPQKKGFALPFPSPQLFGRLAPYFDRPCRRSLTPAQSSVPRITW